MLAMHTSDGAHGLRNEVREDLKSLCLVCSAWRTVSTWLYRQGGRQEFYCILEAACSWRADVLRSVENGGESILRIGV